MQMLTEIAYLLFLAQFAYANHLQGVLIKHHTSSTVSRFQSAFESVADIGVVAKRCAEEAIGRKSLQFHISRPVRWQLSSQSPNNAQHLVPLLPQSPYVCSVAVPNSENTTNYQPRQLSRTFTCSNLNCTKPSDFSDHPHGVFFQGLPVDRAERHLVHLWTTDARHPISYQECKELVGLRNSNRRRAGLGLLNYAIWSEGNTATGDKRVSCRAQMLTKFESAESYEIYIGLMSPQKLWIKHGAPTELTTGDFSSISNISCAQRDIKEDYTPFCKTFMYEVPSNISISASSDTLLPENLDLPLAYRTSYTNNAGRHALTYRQIARINNTRFAIQPRFYRIELPNVNTTQALELCAEYSLRTMHHTFNLYYNHKGWNCVHTFEHYLDAALLSRVDENVLQSYMYSASYHSQNNPDA